jgi:signal transduction histidine kinase
MVGHDIRNPLQAIVNELYFAKQAMTQVPENKNKQDTLEGISIIQGQVDYISKIVSDLQDFSRPLKPEITEVDLSDLITSVLLTINIPDKIDLKIDVKGFPKIKTDPTFIRRVLTNLTNNALQATPDGGKVEIAAFEKENQVIITVADTGKGIPEENKPKLFTPLFTTKSKGQGLGLAVTKRLIEALGGTITFESQEGKGTKFILSLPQKN